MAQGCFISGGSKEIKQKVAVRMWCLLIHRAKGPQAQAPGGEAAERLLLPGHA